MNAPVLQRNRGLTTYLTITGFGVHGNSGDESFKDQLFRNERCQKGAENVRKKFPEFFGCRMPRVRVSPLGPMKKGRLLSLPFFIHKSKRLKQSNAARVSAAGEGLTEPLLNLRPLGRRCKRVSPLGPNLRF